MKIEIKQEDADKFKSWIEDKKKSVRNLNPLWKTLTPMLRDRVSYEFSDANPNLWKPLNAWYRDQKIAEGYPATIGVRTGGLKFAATEGAKIFTKGTMLTWSVDGGHINKEGEAVGNYAGDFNATRPVFKYTVKYITKAIAKAIADWIGTNRSDK